ncbi:alpha/beta hydrolase family protein [Flammeovirga pacifica]|uniref:Peptidase n=1 Tax=Flammeovirga pacifica TaxID=915059 RepID=A0A1S1Z3N3_FLAPC|nr:prolyl oligopeptidase family serine peptidase [Flammeovirga pacifica]OHX67837.1 peptidase [Flammeovirga pacifica]
MKIIKLISIGIGVLFLIASLFFGVKIGQRFYKAYQFKNSLNDTVLDYDITPEDYKKSETLKNGQILSKKIINIKDIPAVWKKVSNEGVLKTEYQHLESIDFYTIIYKSAPKLVNAIIATPKKEGQFPVILFNRGGNKEEGKLAKAKVLFSLIGISRLVDEGNILMASCYREEDEFGGDDINDVLNLTETAKEIQKADIKHIGLIGWSRGGMMTYLALKKSNAFTTAVVGNGPTDMFSLIKERPEMETKVCAKLIPNYEINKEEELKKRSAIFWADELNKNTSLLLLCGSNDKRVNPQQARNMASKLKAISYDYKIMEFDTDHNFSNKSEELNQLLIQWFKNRI